MTYPLKNVDHRKDIMLEKPAPISMHLKHLISMIHEILDYNYSIEVYFILSILNCVISSKYPIYLLVKKLPLIILCIKEKNFNKKNWQDFVKKKQTFVKNSLLLKSTFLIDMSLFLITC